MTRNSRARTGCWGLFGLVRWILFLLAWQALPVPAADALDIGAMKSGAELAPYFAFLETDERDVPIERPGSLGATKEFMTLHAKGPGPRFRWLAAGFTNSGSRIQNMVILVPDQSFTGSGVIWPKPPGPQVVSITTTRGLELQALPASAEQVFAFALPPGGSAAIAFEVASGNLAGATLWQRSAFDAQKDYFAFFRGALLGVAALLTVAMFALYGFRARPVFLAAGGFALASIAFMTFEAGHLLPLLAALRLPPLPAPAVRAVVEGLMAAFTILYLVALADLRRLMPVIGNVLLLLGGLAFAIPLYGLVEPLIASGLARALAGLLGHATDDRPRAL